MSLWITGTWYIILNTTPAINNFQCLFWFDKSVKKIAISDKVLLSNIAIV